MDRPRNCTQPPQELLPTPPKSLFPGRFSFLAIRARGKKPRKPKFGNPPVKASPGLHLREVGRNTPLKIPYGNKEVAQKLGASYGADGWYAPPGVDLSAFKENGWL